MFNPLSNFYVHQQMFLVTETHVNTKVLPPEIKCEATGLDKSTEGTSSIFGFKLVYLFLNGSILV